MKDWTGNKDSGRVMQGINKKHNTEDREANDFYATEPLAMELLLDKETFAPRIWEPSCGQGHLSKVLTARGYQVKSTDLIDRGYGTGGVDFLTQTEQWDGDIITNPPYRYATEFVLHALDLIPTGHKVAMFCKITFLEGAKRWQQIYTTKQLKVVYVATKRLECAINGRFNPSNRLMTYAWFVWQKGYTGQPVIDWINTPGEETTGSLFKEVEND